MDNMKYRAVLAGVSGLERPVQIFGNSFDASMREWAIETVRAHMNNFPGARVEVYETTEVFNTSIWKNDVEKFDEEQDKKAKGKR